MLEKILWLNLCYCLNINLAKWLNAFIINVRRLDLELKYVVGVTGLWEKNLNLSWFSLHIIVTKTWIYTKIDSLFDYYVEEESGEYNKKRWSRNNTIKGGEEETIKEELIKRSGKETIKEVEETTIKRGGDEYNKNKLC